MVDVVCAELPPPGSRLHADVSVRAGGSAVNAARAAAAAGASTVVIGRIGSDPAGDLIAADLRAHGIDAFLARDPELSTGAAVALSSSGSETSVVAHRGANARLSPEDVPDPLEADALMVSGFALLQEGSAAAARAALDRFAGQWAAIDLASPRLAAASAGLDETAGGANVLLATAAEAHVLTGAEPEEAGRLLAARFAFVCVKLGDEGAIAFHEDQLVHRAAKPVVKQSPFGAGDAFGAVFLVGLALGYPLERALESACEAGARAAAHGVA